jgi:hypothetical protein
MFWKLHLNKRPKYFQKRNKKALLSMDVEERVDIKSYPKGNINFNNIGKEVALVVAITRRRR